MERERNDPATLDDATLRGDVEGGDDLDVEQRIAGGGKRPEAVPSSYGAAGGSTETDDLEAGEEDDSEGGTV